MHLSKFVVHLQVVVNVSYVHDGVHIRVQVLNNLKGLGGQRVKVGDGSLQMGLQVVDGVQVSNSVVVSRSFVTAVNEHVVEQAFLRPGVFVVFGYNENSLTSCQHEQSQMDHHFERKPAYTSYLLQKYRISRT